MKLGKIHRRCLLLLFAVVFLCTSCRNLRVAAMIALTKVEGELELIDRRGKDVLPKENLHLFDGSIMATHEQSYAWMNLDSKRLVKLDQESQMEIRKNRKKLEIVMQYGSLFFNIEKPLEKDESLDIRTSSMMVGIRGTCGWVTVEDETLLHVYLLKGKVECSVFDKEGNVLASEILTAGQAARLALDGDIASITVTKEFDIQDIPDFVMEEIEGNEELMKTIQKQGANDTDSSRGESDEMPTNTNGADNPSGTDDNQENMADQETITDQETENDQESEADQENETGQETTTAQETETGQETTTAQETTAGQETTTSPESATSQETTTSPESTTGQETTAAPETTAGQSIREQYSAIVAQASSYEYNTWGEFTGYSYTLYQEESFSVPTLILRKGAQDRIGYLLFRYDTLTGTTSQVGTDTVTRFEFPSHEFINNITDWHQTTDTSALNALAF